MTALRPVMVFDGECRFCRRWIARWRKATRGRVRYVAYQNLGNSLPEISRKACENAVQFRDADGRVYGGADAVVRLFDYGLPGGRPAQFVCSRPPVIWMLRLGYKIVARNRGIMSRIDRACARRRARSRR